MTLTGDMHTTLTTVVRTDDAERAPISFRFITPGVTSVKFGERVATWVTNRVRNERVGRFISRYASRLMSKLLRRLNPDYSFLDSAHWDTRLSNLTPESCAWDVHWVDNTVDSADPAPILYYRIVVPAGRYEISNRSENARKTGGVQPATTEW